MKRIILLVMIALFGGIGLQAQRAGRGGASRTPDERASFTVQRMTATVTMTNEEQTQVTEIFKNFYTEQAPLRAERNHVKILELANARDEKVKTVLKDATKYEAYQKFIAAQRSRAMGGRNKGACRATGS